MVFCNVKPVKHSFSKSTVSQMANILTTAFKEKLAKEVNDEIKKMEEK